MKTRTLLYTLLAILAVGGLLAGFFMDRIERGLIPILPARPTTNVAAKPSGTAAPQATPIATMTQQQQQPTTILAQDTFQRQNQSLWGMASDGRTWNGDANTAPNFSISTKMGRIANGPGTFNALLGQGQQSSEVVLSGAVNSFAGEPNMGATVRWQDDNNWYKALIDGTHLSVFKRLKGASFTLRSVPFKAQPNTMYTLRVRALGAMLFARVWRSDTAEPVNWMLTVSDTSFTNGQNGIRVLMQKDTVITIKSFMAKTASSAM